MPKLSWGIVRYSYRSTASNPVAAFDGWYSDRKLAKLVYDLWLDTYPNAIIALVSSRQIHFG